MRLRVRLTFPEEDSEDSTAYLVSTLPEPETVTAVLCCYCCAVLLLLYY